MFLQCALFAYQEGGVVNLAILPFPTKETSPMRWGTYRWVLGFQGIMGFEFCNELALDYHNIHDCKWYNKALPTQLGNSLRKINTQKTK